MDCSAPPLTGWSEIEAKRSVSFSLTPATTSGSATLEATCEFCFPFFWVDMHVCGVIWYIWCLFQVQPKPHPFGPKWGTILEIFLGPDGPVWPPSNAGQGEHKVFDSLQFLHLQALEVSRQAQLVYVGHSMGTTSFWVMMNWRPWMNQKVGDLC